VNRLVALWHSSIGKKAIMALTGAVIFGYAVGHLLGNLQVFLGAEAIDTYAEKLHHNLPLLWGTRFLLLISFTLHIITALQLTRRSRAAQTRKYEVQAATGDTLASRTMMITGALMALFVIFHLLHLTTGTVHPDFMHLKPHHNLTVGLSVLPVALFYLVAMCGLGFHLYHGVSSMFQTLGINHPQYTPWIKRGAIAFALFVSLGNMTIPLAVLFGIIH
jgi:succinate dehydrogenase / fumarate reductase cytochrome b subunit